MTPHQRSPDEEPVWLLDRRGKWVRGRLSLRHLHPTFFANGPVTWVEELMVDSQYRRRGVGAALMAAAERWSRDGKAAYIALATRRAGDFYAGLEYEESATFYRKLLQPASATSDRSR